jgi:hypothetical protein
MMPGGPMGGSAGGLGLPPPPITTEGPPRRRYEFVVMFVWREPVPNQTLEGALLAPAGGASGMAGPMMMSPSSGQ